MMLLQKGLKIETLTGMFCKRNKIEGQEEKIKQSWKNMSKDFFIDLSKNILEIYEFARKQGLKVEDIHENNMGYRGTELVAYDFI